MQNRKRVLMRQEDDLGNFLTQSMVLARRYIEVIDYQNYGGFETLAKVWTEFYSL